LTLAETDAWATAVLVDEFDPGRFKGATDGQAVGGGKGDFVFSDLCTSDCIHAQHGRVRELLSVPF
jgi:hypothetical protein